MKMYKLFLNILVPILITIMCTIAIVERLSANENVIKRELKKTFLCAEHDYLVNDLTQQWKQERVWYGLSNSNEVVELFINKTDNKFTIIITGTDKISCGLVGGSSATSVQ